MARVRARLLLVLAVLTLSQTAQAQITFDGCTDARGIPVASVVQYGIGDVAKALLAPDGSPIIFYNPAVLAWLAPQTRLWMYAHECGHHALGHVLGSTHPLAAEQGADCFGIRSLANAGQISQLDLRVIQADLARAGRGDWTHLSGPQRAINLLACLGGDALSPVGPLVPTPPLMCCDQLGQPWCRVVTNPLPVGSPCSCPGVPGEGRMCR